MIRLTTISIFLIFFGPIWSQQVPLNNHYMLNPFVFNPGATGASNTSPVNVYLIHNQRFSGFSTNIVNNYLTVDGRLPKGKSGYGFQLAHISHGIQQQISSSLSYSYGIKFGEEHSLRLGVTVGFLDNRIETDNFNILQQDDPYLATMRSRSSTYDISAGLLYSFKSLKIGVAVPQVVGNKSDLQFGGSDRGYYRLARHFMGMAEYTFSIKKKFNITPNILVRYVPNAPIQYDGSLMFDYQKMFWISGTYKSDYAVQFNAGVRIFRQFKVGYSYEYVIGDIKEYSTGMHHEMMLGYTFPTVKKPSKNDVKILEAQQKVEDDLRKKLEEALREKKKLESELAKTQEEKTEEPVEEVPDVVETPVEEKDSILEELEESTEEITVAKGYHFIELDKSDSPDGYYVITGVYGDKANADKVLKQMKTYNSESRLVINQANSFYYVLVFYGTRQRDAVNQRLRYKSITGRKVWVLNYIRNK